MEGLLQPDQLRTRILLWAEEEFRFGRLPVKSGAILEAVLYRGDPPQSRPNVDDKVPDPIVIPHTELSGEALRGVMESFVLREGTDYGEREFSFEEKVAHVLGRLERGEARIMFEPDSETVHIVAA